MRWQGNRQSDHIEDRRGDGGGGGGLPMGRGGLSIGGVLVALVVAWLFGINPLTVLGLMGEGGAVAPTQSVPGPVGKDEATQFVRTVLASTEDVWGPQFKARGAAYRPPTLVLFRGRTATACGQGQAAMGPFYCPADEKVYIDLGFFDTLRSRLGAPGDFAQAYVIAHEVGHHVQNLMGLTAEVDRARRQSSEAEANQMSVRLELQADCLAGIWAHDAEAAQRILEQGDLEEALNAATRIGDDTLAREAGGAVAPDSFTHGTSAQRARWLQTGLQTGDLQQCDTFAARNL